MQRLHEILHQTKLDVKRRKKHLIHVHQRILFEAVFARKKVLLDPQSFCLWCWDTARLSHRRRKQKYFVKPACIAIRRLMTLFVPIPETGEPYIFLDYAPLFKPRSQELWLQFWQIQITSKIIQVFSRDPVWLIATCSWICRLNILQRYWLGRILPWRHFFIWWGKKILIYWRCGYRKIIWMGNRSHSRLNVGIFDLFPRRCFETRYIS